MWIIFMLEYLCFKSCTHKTTHNAFNGKPFDLYLFILTCIWWVITGGGIILIVVFFCLFVFCKMCGEVDVNTCFNDCDA